MTPLKPGDILELRGRRGHAYVQYLGKHPDYGDVVAVAPRLHMEAQLASKSLFDDGYVAFLPVRVALHEQLAWIVGHDHPRYDVPEHVRRDAWPLEPTAHGWLIEDIRGARRHTRTLTADELLLPIGAVWSHDVALHRIESGWRPGLPAPLDDGEADLQSPQPPAVGIIRYFLYFPDEFRARSAGAEVVRNGLEVEVRPAADDIQTLVTASDQFDGDLEKRERLLEEVARRFGGSYDGHEISI